MIRRSEILHKIKQHEFLPIRMFSQSTDLSTKVTEELSKPEPKNFYFVQLMLKGSSTHIIDFNETILNENQILFIVPEAIHSMQPIPDGSEFIKVGFGAELLTYFPNLVTFLLNPLNNYVFQPDNTARERIMAVFSLLNQVVPSKTADKETILSYLYVLLTECNAAYFSQADEFKDTKNLNLFIKFKDYIESNFRKQPSIENIATALGINENALYKLVKERNQMSPKAYLMDRIILEARRKIYFTNISVKELAYDLGYSDPDYFSRLFKKYTSQTIYEFRSQIKDLSS